MFWSKLNTFTQKHNTHNIFYHFDLFLASHLEFLFRRNSKIWILLTIKRLNSITILTTTGILYSQLIILEIDQIFVNTSENTGIFTKEKECVTSGNREYGIWNLFLWQRAANPWKPCNKDHVNIKSITWTETRKFFNLK